MTDHIDNTARGLGSKLVHLPKQRTRKSERDEVLQDLELSIAGHFREQNETLRALNQTLSEKVQRLTLGVERLIDEMNGIRTGKKSEAFARVRTLYAATGGVILGGSEVFHVRSGVAGTCADAPY